MRRPRARTLRRIARIAAPPPPRSTFAPLTHMTSDDMRRELATLAERAGAAPDAGPVDALSALAARAIEIGRNDLADEFLSLAWRVRAREEAHHQPRRTS